MNAWFERWTGWTLQDPELLWLALLPLLAALWAARRKEPSAWLPAAAALRRPFSAIAPTAAWTGVPAPRRSWRLHLLSVPRLLQVGGLLLGILALCRPVRRELEEVTREGIDLLLCVDVSSSMQAQDLEPGRSRLDVVKDAAAEFIAGRPEDRIGLIRFARYPDLRCPPTLDHRALQLLLEDLSLVAADGLEDATGIGIALTRAAQALQRSSAPSRVVVLLTDGVENVATAEAAGEIAPVHAAQLCARLGIRVYVIRAGEEEGASTSMQRALDRQVMRRVAERTSGRLFEARDAGTVRSIYEAIHSLERRALELPRYRLEERFPPLLAAALLLLFLGRGWQACLGGLP